MNSSSNKEARKELRVCVLNGREKKKEWQGNQSHCNIWKGCKNISFKEKKEEFLLEKQKTICTLIKSFPFAYIRFTLHFSVDNVETSENKTKKQRKRMRENKKSKEKFCEMKNRYRERKCKLSFKMWKRREKKQRNEKKKEHTNR